MQLIIDLFNNIAAFLIVLTIIVFVHEFGHYFIARLSGIKIEDFSIGFGKELFGWYDKNGTRWKVCCIPIGGYVKMFGDANYASNPDQDKLSSLNHQELKQSFYTQSLKVKSAVVAAGPIANFILAIVILSVFFWWYGAPYVSNQVSYIDPKSRAEEADIKVGDIITAIDGKTVKDFSEIERIVSISPEIELQLSINRMNQVIIKTVKPEKYMATDDYGHKIKVGRLGIGANIIEHAKYNMLQSINMAFKTTINISYITLKTLGQMIVGKRSIDELGGPIRIAKYSGESMKKGMKMLLWFVAILSINLGLINIMPIPIPIPMLDGGHLMHYLVEAILGKNASEIFQRYSTKIGLVIIIMIFILSTFNDLIQLKLFN
ncbi:Metalloprotease mmpA [Rickettsiales bacterium Ac37b]|nr:Metalloprotease mmpA [Rickettsiales bacterium Ac37b]